MTDVLELGTRKQIYDFIQKNPGVNLSVISTTLHMSTQLIDYHLVYMERHGLISIAKEGGYKRCYIYGKTGVKDQRHLALLRQEIPLRIVLFLLKNPFARHKDMLNSMKISSPRFSYHLRKLVKHNIVIWSTAGDQKGYIVSNEHEIIQFLITYKPTSVLTMVEDTWADFAPIKKQK